MGAHEAVEETVEVSAGPWVVVHAVGVPVAAEDLGVLRVAALASEVAEREAEHLVVGGLRHQAARAPGNRAAAAEVVTAREGAATAVEVEMARVAPAETAQPYTSSSVLAGRPASKQCGGQWFTRYTPAARRRIILLVPRVAPRLWFVGWLVGWLVGCLGWPTVEHSYLRGPGTLRSSSAPSGPVTLPAGLARRRGSCRLLGSTSTLGARESALHFKHFKEVYYRVVYMNGQTTTKLQQRIRAVFLIMGR
jgi:hypothetical protein